MHQHFILCGLGRIGLRVLQQLRVAGADVVAIDNRCAPGDPRLEGATLICGDCRPVGTNEGHLQQRDIMLN